MSIPVSSNASRIAGKLKFSLDSTKPPGKIKSNLNLAMDCVHHAKMFFNNPSLDLTSAYPGSYSLVLTEEMKKVLKRVYQAMRGMIFGEITDFDVIMDSIFILEMN